MRKGLPNYRVVFKQYKNSYGNLVDRYIPQHRGWFTGIWWTINSGYWFPDLAAAIDAINRFRRPVNNNSIVWEG